MDVYFYDLWHDATISPQSRRLCVYHMQLGISVALPRLPELNHSAFFLCLSTAHSRWRAGAGTGTEQLHPQVC
jgi:hypothetical protein